MLAGMKRGRLLVLSVVAAGLCGCQTFPSDRIAADQAGYNAWPADVRANVRAGRIAVGYTEEQVRVALGEPSLKTQAGDPGNLSEVWVYRREAPRFSFGIGGAGMGGHSAVAGGVSASGIKLGLDENGRVLFHNGLVHDFSVQVR